MNSVGNPPPDQAQADPTQHPGAPLQLPARHLLSGVQANHPCPELNGAGVLVPSLLPLLASVTMMRGMPPAWMQASNP